MGRTEKSQGLAPPSVRKDMRAKQAKQIINKTIPAILASNSRARKGSESSELISDPGPNIEAPARSTPTQHAVESEYVKRKGQGRRKMKTADKHAEPEVPSKPESTAPVLSSPPKRRIRIITTDTLTAASILTIPAKQPSSSTPSSKPPKNGPNTCILSMASPLRPGGGVLTGATSQEEFLCARTTLLPSLNESFYRLPELGGIWSPDVLVFRNQLPLSDAAGEIPALHRFFVNVVSAGMLRFPELEAGRLASKDRDAVEKKMRGVLRVLERKGCRRVVLGAWGCGAYAVPVGDVAGAWRRVIDGLVPSHKKSKAAAETWPGIQDIVFAISNRKMAADFARAFDPDLVVEDAPGDAVDEDSDEEDKEAEELRSKIREMEGQVSLVWNADLKARMGSILEGLKAQLREREGASADDDEDDGEKSVGGVQLTPEDSEEEEEEEEGRDDDAYSGEESGEDLDTRIART
jgi:uncharacterized protein (TIGR02452 family)